MNQILEHEEPLEEYERALKRLKMSPKRPELEGEILHLEERLQALKEKVYRRLGAWERVQISRHPARPRSEDLISHCFDHFEELHGDRLFRDDPAIIAGLARFQEKSLVLIAQEKGRDTPSRMRRNFGMVHPEGFRKAKRMMDLAEKFSLPILTLVDTPGAFPGLEAEQRGQGWAIAENLKRMATLKVPILSLILGEGCSGGALGIALADHITMLEHAYYSVISPEGCASILWKDASKTMESAEMMRLNAEYLLEQKVVDEVLKEPLGGAHNQQQELYQSIKEHLEVLLKRWSKVPIEQLQEKRWERYRNYGKFEETTRS